MRQPGPEMNRLFAALAATLLLAAGGAGSKTLRWGSQGDYQTADPHSQNELLTNLFSQQVHDTLVMRDKELRIVAGLALSWSQPAPLVWRFNLRRGVRFHDGSPFTADDVVFSFERASHANSQIRQYAIPVTGKPRKIDEIVYTPIASDATRVAALLSGQIDFILDPPPQDLDRLRATAGIKVVDGMENRVIFFGFDQARDELLYSNVKGRNPFQDVRVRRAVYQAIDIEALRLRTMRGAALPTGGITPSILASNPAAEKRLPYDPNEAKRLLAAAGYPSGFEVTLDCPNNRYINDEKICLAVAAMLSKVGIQTKVTAQPRATYFPKLEKLDTSFYMLGWGGAITDAQTTLSPVLRSFDAKSGNGSFNYGRYVNPKLDALIDAAAVEMNADQRADLIRQALAEHNAQVHHVPLHRQVIPWAMRSNVNAVHRADNWLMGEWTRID